jgi:uncharacterized protein YjbI with pentapeptide repeats
MIIRFTFYSQLYKKNKKFMVKERDYGIVDFKEADLKRANLEVANLRAANLREVNLEEADLSYTQRDSSCKGQP